MPAVPIIIGAAVASGAAAAIGAAAVGAITAATISSAVATAVGVGLISGTATAIQGGKASDVLRSAVIGGVASYVGGQVASRVTSAVAQQTGASLVDLEPALRSLSGEGASAAGVVAITAGNVAGQAATAAITGAPIQQAALFGLAQSVPTALTSSQDFRSLNPVVQNVLASSAQAAIMGQDVGDAAIASLVASSGIVARAIKEIPGGEQFIQQNPIYAKYVIDSVSSALTAQLQGKDVTESVLYSLARTTADVLSDKFKDAQAAKEVQDANNAYKQAQQEQKNIEKLVADWEQEQKKYTSVINNYDYALNQYNNAIQNAQSSSSMAQYYADQLNDPRLDSMYRENAAAQRASLRSFLDMYNNETKANNDIVKREKVNFDGAKKLLNSSGFIDAQAQYEQQINDAVSRFEALTALVNQGARTLTENSSNLFIDFETELATTLAPLTAFEETDVTDQDVLAQISPVAPPSSDIYGYGYGQPDEYQAPASVQVAQAAPPPVDPFAYTPPTELAQGPAPVDPFAYTPPTDIAQPSPEVGVEVAGPVSPEILSRLQSMPLYGEKVYKEIETPAEEGSSTGSLNMRYIEGYRTDGTPYYYAIGTFENGDVIYAAYQDGEPTIFDSRPELKNSSAGFGDAPVDSGGAGGGGATGTGTGTPGAPAVDLGAQAPTEVVDPQYSILFDLRDYGPGSPLSPNRAVFEVGGGRGFPGGSTSETTFNLISKGTYGDGTGDTYNVGGETYSLIVLPGKQVLVPETPKETVIYLERDPETNLPKMKEVPLTQVPPADAEKIVEKEIEKELAKDATEQSQAPGGEVEGAEGATGGLTAETPSTTTPTEQLQPGVRPTDVAPGVSAESPAPSFPDLISGITEPTMPLPAPGADAGFEDALQAPGAGGIGDEITDEEIIRIIQGEMGEAGGGEGEGLPGEEGEGTGTGEEGEGPGAGEEGDGTGAGGEGGGTGEGIGLGAGEGETPDTQLPQPSPDIVPTITTVGRRTFARPAEGAPYRVTGQDESGILGRKQPLFGGDEDLQRAEWNRRSLRLRRLLGL